MSFRSGVYRKLKKHYTKLVAALLSTAFLVVGFCVPAQKHAHDDGEHSHGHSHSHRHSHSHSHAHNNGKPHTQFHRESKLTNEESEREQVPHLHFYFLGYEFSVRVAPDESIPIVSSRINSSRINRTETMVRMAFSPLGDVIPTVSASTPNAILLPKSTLYLDGWMEHELEITNQNLVTTEIAFFDRDPDRPPVPPPRNKDLSN